MTATANLAQALGGGPPSTETSDVPIEHLDYEYINKCSSGKELEQILRVLRFVRVFGVVLVYSCFVLFTLFLLLYWFSYSSFVWWSREVLMSLIVISD